jgi:hypothetical protein
MVDEESTSWGRRARREAALRIAYITADEVNRDLGARFADRLGADVTSFHPEAVGWLGLFDALLYDLDGVPPEGRPALLDRMLSDPPSCPTAVHGHCLPEDKALALRLHGVAVAQRLHVELIRRLCRAALRELSTVPPDDALSDTTWIDLDE